MSNRPGPNLDSAQICRSCATVHVSDHSEFACIREQEVPCANENQRSAAMAHSRLYKTGLSKGHWNNVSPTIITGQPRLELEYYSVWNEQTRIKLSEAKAKSSRLTSLLSSCQSIPLQKTKDLRFYDLRQGLQEETRHSQQQDQTQGREWQLCPKPRTQERSGGTQVPGADSI